MNKQIERIRTAYDKRCGSKLLAAAKALVAYDKRHPMAVVCNPGAAEMVKLAQMISQAPECALSDYFLEH